VQVGVWLAWEVEVDDHIHRDDIDTASEHIRRDEASCLTTLEVVENAISVSLIHARVNEEAAVAELADFLGEHLDSLGAVAENDGLRDVELGEERVEAVELLALLQEGVVLGQTLQRQLISNLDVLGSWHVALLERADLYGVSRTEQANLAIDGHHLQNLLNHLLELA